MSKPLDQAASSSSLHLEDSDLVLLERHLDGELDNTEQQRFEARLQASPDLRDELHLAQRIDAGLHALPAMECPPRVTWAVQKATEASPEAPPQTAAWRWRALFTTPVFRSAIALGAVAVLVAVGLLLPSPPPQIPDAEVQRAEQEVKLALAYLGHIGQRASEQVSEEVLNHRLVAPVARTVGNLTGTLDEGDSRETL